MFFEMNAVGLLVTQGVLSEHCRHTCVASWESFNLGCGLTALYADKPHQYF